MNNMILKENEWNTMNNILLDMYEIRDINELTDRLLKTFRMLIPYTQGYYLIFNKEGKIDVKQSSFIFSDDNSVDEYLKHYYHVDYLKYVSDFTKKTVTYRDTDILDEDIRKKTEFYREFLRPKNIPYGCGIILLKEEKIIGIINLFRSSELGDFSDKDLYILDTLKLHLRNIQYHLCAKEIEGKESKLDSVCKQYELSEREGEVVQLVNDGCSNSEIGEKLSISISTVKKHFYNIYNKTGVKNRTQLLVLFK